MSTRLREIRVGLGHGPHLPLVWAMSTVSWPCFFLFELNTVQTRTVHGSQEKKYWYTCISTHHYEHTHTLPYEYLQKTEPPWSCPCCVCDSDPLNMFLFKEDALFSLYIFLFNQLIYLFYLYYKIMSRIKNDFNSNRIHHTPRIGSTCKSLKR